MKSALWIVMVAAPVSAQNADLVRGEKVFAANCSVPYCHGPNGTAGRAPKLVGHTFTARELTNTVSNGIANKGMPSFGGQLSPEDIDTVISYLMTLRGSPLSTGTAATPVRTVLAESPGKALFFDAVRMGGCGRCHELEKHGSRVAPELKNIPRDLRAVAASHTVTVSAKAEDSFPGIVVERSEKSVRVYDLSSQLPVLRTFAAGTVEVTAGSTWKHRDATGAYSDIELQEIAAYLQSTSGR